MEMTMTDELEQLLKNLRLGKIVEICDEELARAEKEQIAYTELLLRLLRPQWHARLETALKWRIKHAGMPELWSLETFPWTKQPGVNRRQIRGFADLEFIGHAENIVASSPKSVGEIWLG